MLHEPYIKLDSKTDYDVYILAEGVSPLHLALVHKEMYTSEDDDGTTTDVEVPTSLKMLPLNHLVLATMHLVSEATPIAEIDGKDDYAQWIPAIAHKLRMELASMVVNGEINDHYEFHELSKNKVVKALIADRHMILLGVENRGVLSRVYWLGRMNSDGDLSLASVSEFGNRLKTTVTTDISMYGINRNSIPEIMNYVTEYYASNAPDATTVVDGEPIGDEIIVNKI